MYVTDIDNICLKTPTCHDKVIFFIFTCINNFFQQQVIPGDAKVIRAAWATVNRNSSMDALMFPFLTAAKTLITINTYTEIQLHPSQQHWHHQATWLRQLRVQSQQRQNQLRHLNQVQRRLNRFQLRLNRVQLPAPLDLQLVQHQPLKNRFLMENAIQTLYLRMRLKNSIKSAPSLVRKTCVYHFTATVRKTWHQHSNLQR